MILIALFRKFLSNKFIVSVEKISENDQEIPQSHTADQPMGPWARDTEN